MYGEFVPRRGVHTRSVVRCRTGLPARFVRRPSSVTRARRVERIGRFGPRATGQWTGGGGLVSSAQPYAAARSHAADEQAATAERNRSLRCRSLRSSKPSRASPALRDMLGGTEPIRWWACQHLRPAPHRDPSRRWRGTRAGAPGVSPLSSSTGRATAASGKPWRGAGGAAPNKHGGGPAQVGGAAISATRHAPPRRAGDARLADRDPQHADGEAPQRARDERSTQKVARRIYSGRRARRRRSGQGARFSCATPGVPSRQQGWPPSQALSWRMLTSRRTLQTISPASCTTIRQILTQSA